jgi:hypothetical protein
MTYPVSAGNRTARCASLGNRSHSDNHVYQELGGLTGYLNCRVSVRRQDKVCLHVLSPYGA